MPSQKNPALLADPDALKDWDRRVRRLANAYAPKYRPLVLPIGYGQNLSDGHTFKKLDTIIAESARWTYNRKPMDRRNAMRYLAEMKAVGALLAEERFRDDTGRQTSSYRSLDTSIAVDRRGKPVAHDFWAPFDESPQVTEGFTTPQTTPLPLLKPPLVPPELSLMFSENYQGTNSYLSPAARSDEERCGGLFSGEEEKPGLGNIYIVRTWKSGKQAYSRLDRALGLAARGAFSDRSISLTDAEASWMWTTWPGDHPQRKEKHLGFLLASPGERAALMGDARDESHGDVAQHGKLPGTEQPDDTHVYPVIVTKDGIQGRANGQMPRRHFGHVARYLTQQQGDNRFGGWRAEMYRIEPRSYTERWGNGEPTGRALTWYSRSGEPHAERGRCWVQTRA